MDKILPFLKAHWPAIAAFAAAFWGNYGTTITAFVTAHPKYAQAFGFAAFIFGFYLKSPRQKALTKTPAST